MANNIHNISTYGRLFCLTLGLFAVLLAAPAFASCSDPEQPIGTVIYNPDFDVFQGCIDGGWVAFHEPFDCAIGPVGTVCLSDGAIYAGNTVNGARMYVADAMHDVSRIWKTSNTPTPNTTSTSDGLANTNAMVADGIAAHPAAQTCVNKPGGNWYLPANNELQMVYDNFSHLATWRVWTSTQTADHTARSINFDSGTANNFETKSNGANVLCVRR